jgi:hypothetical protein
MRGLTRYGTSAWGMIRELVSSDPALNDAAWEALRVVTGLLPAETENGARRVVGGYLEF